MEEINVLERLAKYRSLPEKEKKQHQLDVAEEKNKDRFLLIAIVCVASLVAWFVNRFNPWAGLWAFNLIGLAAVFATNFQMEFALDFKRCFLVGMTLGTAILWYFTPSYSASIVLGGILSLLLLLCYAEMKKALGGGKIGHDHCAQRTIRSSEPPTR